MSFSDGCHDGAFFTAQDPLSLAFLAHHLTPTASLSGAGAGGLSGAGRRGRRRR